MQRVLYIGVHPFLRGFELYTLTNASDLSILLGFFFFAYMSFRHFLGPSHFGRMSILIVLGMLFLHAYANEYFTGESLVDRNVFSALAALVAMDTPGVSLFRVTCHWLVRLLPFMAPLSPEEYEEHLRKLWYLLPIAGGLFAVPFLEIYEEHVKVITGPLFAGLKSIPGVGRVFEKNIVVAMEDIYDERTQGSPFFKRMEGYHKLIKKGLARTDKSKIVSRLVAVYVGFFGYLRAGATFWESCVYSAKYLFVVLLSAEMQWIKFDVPKLERAKNIMHPKSVLNGFVVGLLTRDMPARCMDAMLIALQPAMDFVGTCIRQIHGMIRDGKKWQDVASKLAPRFAQLVLYALSFELARQMSMKVVLAIGIALAALLFVPIILGVDFDLDEWVTKRTSKVFPEDYKWLRSVVLAAIGVFGVQFEILRYVPLFGRPEKPRESTEHEHDSSKSDDDKKPKDSTSSNTQDTSSNSTETAASAKDNADVKEALSAGATEASAIDAVDSLTPAAQTESAGSSIATPQEDSDEKGQEQDSKKASSAVQLSASMLALLPLAFVLLS